MRFVSPAQRAAVMGALRRTGAVLTSRRTLTGAALGGTGLVAARSTSPHRRGGEAALAARYGLGTYGAHRVGQAVRGRMLELARGFRHERAAQRAVDATYWNARGTLGQAYALFRMAPRSEAAREAWRLAARQVQTLKGQRAIGYIDREASKSALRIWRRVGTGAGVLRIALPAIGAAHLGYRTLGHLRGRYARARALPASTPIVFHRKPRPPRHVLSPGAIAVIKRQHER